MKGRNSGTMFQTEELASKEFQVGMSRLVLELAKGHSN